MDNNNEQENGSDVDGGDLFERIYLGQPLDNIPDVPFRLIIDASVLMIDEEACEGCRHLLREVVFHNNVTEIGYAAFAGCHNLERVELLEGLLRVERDAFRGCTSLREIVIPASVQYMRDLVFCYCKSLQRVVFAPRTTSIELGSGIFWDCSILQFVTLPQNLQSIPARFFMGCILLTRLQIPVSVNEFGERAFRGSGLRSVTISENVHRISWDAFGNCAFLERVIIYSINLNLRTNIFGNCPLLSTIMIAPWLWPKLFVSMQEHPEFILKFFRQYHTKILDFETPVVRRPLQQLRRDRKRTAAMVDDTI